jgi:predicted DNA-binding antitoxin AbrB/MazE fold protein
MAVRIAAIYENGLFRPIEPVALPEGTIVQVSFECAIARPEP